jgi:hypothetical protein
MMWGADADSDTEIEEAYLAQARKRLIIAAVPTTLITLLVMPHMSRREALRQSHAWFRRNGRRSPGRIQLHLYRTTLHST